MLHKTKGIVLRTVNYGETSIIATLYTELFGMQSYMVKGVRKNGAKVTAKANMFQPASILDMVVYHNELKHLQIIKEFKWGHLYQGLHVDVMKNCVALFMVELLQKSIKQPQTDPDLFYFIEENLMLLDQADEAVTANMPMFFALHLSRHIGTGMEAGFDEQHPILDLQAGHFTQDIPLHGHYLEGRLAQATHELLEVDNAVVLFRVKLNRASRQQLLKAYESFYQFHVHEFGQMKTLPVLEAVLS